MNANKRVFLFIFSSLILYLIFSYVNLAYHKSWEPFDRINLIADIVSTDTVAAASNLVDSTETDIALSQILSDKDSLVKEADTVSSKMNTQKDSGIRQIIPPISLPASLNHQGIIAFSDDTSRAALKHFVSKLMALKNGEQVKVRIAYLGDSMIEGDLLSQTLRSLLQQIYGGKGVGFVPIASQVSQFRQTAVSSSSEGWKDLNFKNTKRRQLFLSGHLFLSSGNDWVKIRDNTSRDTSVVLGKYLLYGVPTDTSFIQVNKKNVSLTAKSIFNRQLLFHNKEKSLTVSTTDQNLPLFGVSFESDNGIIVDNFSFRGISGLEFGKIDTEFLKAINEVNPYDLIIFQYGVNVLYRPDDTNFSWYKKAAIPVITKMKNCFPETDFLIVGTGDRAFRYPEGYQSATGIEALIKEQAALAKQTNCAFFSLYAAMGGKNSMVNWATQSPSLANKDYVHPNALGARILGKHLFEAITQDVKKMEKSKRNDD